MQDWAKEYILQGDMDEEESFDKRFTQNLVAKTQEIKLNALTKLPDELGYKQEDLDAMKEKIQTATADQLDTFKKKARKRNRCNQRIYSDSCFSCYYSFRKTCRILRHESCRNRSFARRISRCPYTDRSRYPQIRKRKNQGEYYR